MLTIIDTEANRRAMPNVDYSKWVKPSDLANVVLFLCSDDAKVITGAAISTYGLASLYSWKLLMTICII
jgi:NAD(P)-dependent dehydrogenase (short-subunit alcohol dehydrogenase family)